MPVILWLVCLKIAIARSKLICVVYNNCNSNRSSDINFSHKLYRHNYIELMHTLKFAYYGSTNYWLMMLYRRIGVIGTSAYF